MPDTLMIDGVAWAFHRSEAGGFVAVCDALQLTAEGEDLEDLRDTIREIQAAASD